MTCERFRSDRLAELAELAEPAHHDQFCSAVLPKPIPGSIKTRSRGTPARSATINGRTQEDLDLVHHIPA